MLSADKNSYSLQVILERAQKIDKKLSFEGEYSYITMDSHVRKRLSNIHV